MSLSPIQLYTQQQNPLAQILAGGNNVVTGIFDRAIQIGRDMSNKQLQQEQDMLAMRQQETNMAQRRAENLQQNNEDAIKFARSAYESDRKFSVDQTQQSFQNNRVTAQDLFSNQQSTERLELAYNADQRAARDQTLQENTAVANQKLQQANLDYYDKEYGNSPSEDAPESPVNLFYNPSMENKSPASSQPDSESVDSLYSERERLQSDLRGAPKNPALRSRIASQLGAVEEKIKALPSPSSTKPPTQLQLDSANRAKEDQNAQNTARADKDMEERVLGNTSAFTSAQANEIKAYGDVAKVPQSKMAEAQLYDKDRYVSEKASARRMTKPEYLKKGPQDAASQKAREELWNHVNLGGAPATSQAPANPAEADLGKLLQP